ncbi:hypothetical protein BT67DRAFT_233347 [Trichocladium antarcticum]|uniref:Uncharacterized protein n=1 Tax=Trichocladium antarcticum TaxID=1450529 RepID=A0AAN6UQR9_9PEZI|nr:hypothetical protein BT67DRAFT_233347 [Trichocladium antarcticum]
MVPSAGSLANNSEQIGQCRAAEPKCNRPGQNVAGVKNHTTACHSPGLLPNAPSRELQRMVTEYIHTYIQILRDGQSGSLCAEYCSVSEDGWAQTTNGQTSNTGRFLRVQTTLPPLAEPFACATRSIRAGPAQPSPTQPSAERAQNTMARVNCCRTQAQRTSHRRGSDLGQHRRKHLRGHSQRTATRTEGQPILLLLFPSCESSCDDDGGQRSD